MVQNEKKIFNCYFCTSGLQSFVFFPSWFLNKTWFLNPKSFNEYQSLNLNVPPGRSIFQIFLVCIRHCSLTKYEKNLNKSSKQILFRVRTYSLNLLPISLDFFPDRTFHNFWASKSGDRRFYVEQKRWSPDREALKLWNSRSGFRSFSLFSLSIK